MERKRYPKNTKGISAKLLSVGSGFVISPDGTSSQIDILVLDESTPVFFRDGDFIVAPPDGVRATIEVKTRLSGSEVGDALGKLQKISQLLRRRCIHPRPFIGLFAYEQSTQNYNVVLNSLEEQNAGAYPINALCFGNSQFYRFWEYDPATMARLPYDSWHAYDLPDLAPGYFIHNLVEHLYPQILERAQQMWYPAKGKEDGLLGIRKKRQ